MPVTSKPQRLPLPWLALWVAAACGWSAAGRLSAAAMDEFKVKRQETFEFTEKPKAKRAGDRIEIAFAVKAACDVTVALEDASGKIVRHLACGVLGANAPEPFQKNSLAQTLVWDGKDDQGKYLDDKERLAVRVSLGLDPRFERTLFWEPKRRHGRDAPKIQALEDGVYVYDGGNGLDYVKCYSHKGDYVRTVYPFPAGKIEELKGLVWQISLQDGLKLPYKPTFLQQTFLTCGNYFGYEGNPKYAFEAEPASGMSHYGMYGNAATFFAAASGKIVLGDKYLNRFGTDGGSGGMSFEGPRCAVITKGQGIENRGKIVSVGPHGGALSPDGKKLYLTGYNFCHYGRASADIVTSGQWEAIHGVAVMDADGDVPAKLFAGNLESEKPSSDNQGFKVPVDVAVDKAGRVYVADQNNNRVQIFAPDGKYLKSLPVEFPAQVCIHPKSGEVYVFSWMVCNLYHCKDPKDVKAQLTVFGSFDDPKPRGKYPLPQGYESIKGGYLYSGSGFPMSAAVDGWTDPPTVWITREWTRENVLSKGKVTYYNVQLYTFKDGKFDSARDFGKEVAASIPRGKPAAYARQRLNLNPKTGKLYVAEGETANNIAFKEVVELDPETGKARLVPLPFDAEDLCFDHDGFAYLRNISVVARYEPEGWREVPWDYGEERAGVCTSSSSDRKMAHVLSGLVLPSNAGWHHGGMYVALNGQLLVSCGYHMAGAKRTDEAKVEGGVGKPYEPKLYAGRNVEGRGGGAFFHIWDKHGRLVAEDTVQGLTDPYGVGLDARGDIYFLIGSTRILDGKRYPNNLTGTLMKFKPHKGKVFSEQKNIPLPMTDEQRPKGSPDLVSAMQGTAWVEGVEWMYGGVGFGGKNRGIGCACWNTRFALDYFGRSFAPEMDRYRVAVLDANGNLILRLGQYGNADDGKPLIAAGGPAAPHPLGGDEVALMHGAYVAIHTDRRLFIADPVNERILSVKLGYRAAETIQLKNVADQAATGK